MAKKNLEKKTIELQENHAKLELHVEERTTELSKANELLKKENAKRQQAEKTLQAIETNLRKLYSPALTVSLLSIEMESCNLSTQLQNLSLVAKQKSS